MKVINLIAPNTDLIVNFFLIYTQTGKIKIIPCGVKVFRNSPWHFLHKAYIDKIIYSVNLECCYMKILIRHK